MEVFTPQFEKVAAIIKAHPVVAILTATGIGSIILAYQDYKVQSQLPESIIYLSYEIFIFYCPKKTSVLNKSFLVYLFNCNHLNSC